MTKAQAFARKIALSVLKAYHHEIKSVYVADSSAVEREKGQSAAFEVAEHYVRLMQAMGYRECCGADPMRTDWLDEKGED